MDFFCVESAQDRSYTYCYADPKMEVTSRDYRFMNAASKNYLIPFDYFGGKMQTQVTPEMRRILAQWLLEVCDEENLIDEVFPLTMNIIDRFLCKVEIRKTQMQLLGCVACLIATKVRQPEKFFAREKLVMYTDDSVSVEELKEWECLVLAYLGWDVSAILPIDFIEYLLNQLSIAPQHLSLATKHSRTFASLSASDHKFMLYSPSCIAAACVTAALKGINWILNSSCPKEQVMQRIHQATHLDMRLLEECLELVENMTKMITASSMQQDEPSSLTQSHHQYNNCNTSKIHSYENDQPETPTDLLDIEF